MPTYDYRCEKCGNEFEEFLPMAKRIEPTEKPCNKQLHQSSPFPACGGKISQVPGLTPPAFNGPIKRISNVLSPRDTQNLPDWVKDKKVIQKQQRYVESTVKIEKREINADI